MVRSPLVRSLHPKVRSLLSKVRSHHQINYFAPNIRYLCWIKVLSTSSTSLSWTSGCLTRKNAVLEICFKHWFPCQKQPSWSHLRQTNWRSWQHPRFTWKARVLDEISVTFPEGTLFISIGFINYVWMVPMSKAKKQTNNTHKKNHKAIHFPVQFTGVTSAPIWPPFPCIGTPIMFSAIFVWYRGMVRALLSEIWYKLAFESILSIFIFFVSF